MALALGAVLVTFWMDGDDLATVAPQRGRTRERHKFATRRQMCEGSGRVTRTEPRSISCRAL
jgi:hypothetical protein